MENCNCLPSCNEVKYNYVIDSKRKLSDNEIEQHCNYGTPHMENIRLSEEARYDLIQVKNMTLEHGKYSKKVCRNYLSTQYARIKLKIDGTTHSRQFQTLRVSGSDKFAKIGGILTFSTGFSLIVIMELFYWIIATTKKMLTASDSDGVKVSPENGQIDPAAEIASLKSQLSEVKENELKLIMVQLLELKEKLGGLGTDTKRMNQVKLVNLE